MSNSSEKFRLLRRRVSIGKALLAREQEEYDTNKARKEKRKKIKVLARNLVAAKRGR